MLLLVVFRAAAVEFRTAWFVESLLTELAVALVVRTRRPFFRSRPGRFLLWSTVATAAVAFALPVLAARAIAGVHRRSRRCVVALIVAITVAYVAAAEALKRAFYRSEEPMPPQPPAVPQILRAASSRSP